MRDRGADAGRRRRIAGRHAIERQERGAQHGRRLEDDHRCHRRRAGQPPGDGIGTEIARPARDPPITSVLVGASSVAQLETNVRAASARPFERDELAAIEAALAPR